MGIDYNAFLQLRKRILERVFSRMNPMQQQAVFTINGPLLILAGAGSGKTTVVVNRIANMVKYGNAYHSAYMPDDLLPEDFEYLEQVAAGGEYDEDRLINLLAFKPVRPWNILAITFTNKAAGELKERLVAMLGEEANDIQASTFHSACVRILRRDIERLGYERKFSIYDTDDSLRVIKDVLKHLNIDEKQFPPKTILSAIGRYKDNLTDPKEAIELAGNDYRKKVESQVYAEYQKRLRANGALDFDDIICKTVELFQQFPEVLSYYQNRFKYIMVDEYQDTNHAQYMLVGLLSQTHKNLCVVGDDDQSIYRFRGATIENILSFEHQFDDAKVIRLEQNYRCTQTILDAANAVIANNTERKGKTLWTANDKGTPVFSYRGWDEQNEAQFVAESVLENVAKGAKFSDHAVLYRMNAQSNNIEKYFVRSGIPYRIIGGHRFYERKEIKDVMSYLHVINNPNDNVRLKRIINEPKRGIGEATIAAAENIAAGLGISLFEVLKEAGTYADLSKKSKVLTEFCGMMQKMMDSVDEMELTDLLEMVLENSTYRKFLKAQGEEGAARLENVAELSSNMQKYSDENEDASLAGFLEEVSLFTDLDNYDPDADSVVMMTMHSAKGLEFPYVYIVGMEDGIFPGMQSMFSQSDLEEERRLAYVAITRAKQRLYVTNAASRLLYGQTQRNKPSRFLREVPRILLEEKDVTIVKSQVVPQDHAMRQRQTLDTGKSIGISNVTAQPQAEYQIGQTVEHKAFGEGVILKITPMGNDHMLEIAFESAGTKRLMGKFAKLTIVK